MAIDESVADRTVDDMKDFLLKEYDYITEYLQNNAHTGETRVNWFITTITAASAGLIALSGKGFDTEQYRLIVQASLFSMLIIGIITLIRLLKRWRKADEYRDILDDIRKLFKKGLTPDSIQMYNPFPAVPREKRRWHAFGGLVHLVAGINSLLIAFLAGVSVFPFDAPKNSWVITYTLFFFGFLVGWVLFSIIIEAGEYAGKKTGAKRK